MQIVKPSVELINPLPYKEMLNTVERATRNCYQSQDRIAEGSAEKLIKNCIKRGHLSITEFGDITVKIIGSRSLLSQITRQRLASFAVESQRYVKYDDIKVIQPEGLNNEAYECWLATCKVAEAAYCLMLKDHGMKPEIARSVLPNCTATIIFMKANIREWRHIISLRISPAAQKEIRDMATELLKKFYELYPVFFEDLYERYIDNG